ncbi:MAG: ABC transporter substrate-binding protein [Nitrosomonadales bacterium]|nr:ABC transporter substrate-binding protein [Nitrosomonadales bacterium]
MKRFVVLWLGVLLAGVPLAARAEMPEPDVLIKNTVQEVLAIVKQDKDIQAGNQKKILELVDAKVLPHFDFARMTQLAVGKYWRTATPEQKQSLVTEFRNLLVRTYTKAFTVYRDQTVEVKPFKMPPGATEVTIKTVIIKPGESNVPVDYDMEKTAAGWKAFDLSIEGVSLVTNYRSTFSDQIQQAGIDGLIKTLVEKNQVAASAPLRKAEPQKGGS